MQCSRNTLGVQIEKIMKPNLLLSLLLLALLAGCQATPKRIVFETLQGTTEIVQVSLVAFGEYLDATGDVEAEAIVPQLRQAYEHYQTVALAAVMTAEWANAPATAEVVAAAVEVLSLTARFVKVDYGK